MKISLIGYKGSGVELFKDLANELSKRISGLDLSERFVLEPEDIPFVSLEETENSDLIFVFAFVNDDKTARMIKQKLVDVEIKSETRIIKAIDSDSLSSSDEYEFEEQKKELVKKYSDLIVATLYNENEFEPSDKKFDN